MNTAPAVNIYSADVAQPNDNLQIAEMRPMQTSPVPPFQDPTGRLGIGAYTVNGEVFVHADSHDMGMLHGYEVKQLCFKHRVSIGMMTAGIEFPIGPYACTAAELKQVPAVVPVQEGKPLYRIIYKLNSVG